MTTETSVPDVGATAASASLPLRPEPPVAPAPARIRGLTSLLRLHGYLRPYTWRWVVMFLFALLGTLVSIVVPLITRAAIDGPIAGRDSRGVWTLGALAIAVGVTEALSWFVRRWVVSRAALGVETDLRKDLYARLQGLPMAFHGKWPSGQLLSRVMSDLGIIRRLLGFGLVFLFLNFVQVVVVTTILLRTYLPLGLVVVASFVPIVLVVFRNERRISELSRQVQDESGDLASSVEESAHGLRTIKAFGRAEHMFGRYDERAVALYRTSVEKVRVLARFWTFLEVIPNVALIVVLGLGAYAVGRDEVTIGTLVLFLTMMLSLVWPIASLGFLLTMVQEAMTAADRVVEVMDARSAIVDGNRALVAPAGRVRFESVCFRFPDADADVLTGVDLDIAAGETLAVVGATGSGKTVLTSLVPRLQDVTGGRITIDGVDIRELTLPALRSIVATAFEDPTLFSMSVRENITLGRPDASADDIDEAIEVAQAGFVHDLPWGLDTRIGEQGLSLSGGQRQRLALARAVLARPKVLVLDDTLSALDVHTEALVEQALRRVLVGVTGIVVAHRASTVLIADRVALLAGGTISHVGTHAELLATVPAYRELLAADTGLDPDVERSALDHPYGDPPMPPGWEPLRRAERLTREDDPSHSEDHEEAHR